MVPIMPALPEQFERLKDENVRLQRELAALRGQLAARPLPAPAVTNAAVSQQAFIPSGSSLAGHGVTPLPARSGGSSRTHTITAGDTFTTIARKYQVKLAALTAANPTVDPRRMQPGRVLNIPPPCPCFAGFGFPWSRCSSW